MDFYDKDLVKQEDGGQTSNESGSKEPLKRQTNSKGPWHFVLSLVTLTLACLASASIAYFFSDVSKRSWWQMGLTFFVPATAVAFGAYLVEHSTNAMTPRLSRKAQSLVALAVALMAFVMGSVSIPREEPVITVKTQDNIIILMDLSTSMGYDEYPNRYPDSVNAIQNIYESLDEGTFFGIIQFSHEIVGEIPFGPKDQAQEKQFQALMKNTPSGGTGFDQPIDDALSMVVNAKLSDGERISLIMVTDADDGADISPDNLNYFVRKASDLGVSFSYLQLEQTKPSGLEEVVKQTGGQSVLVGQSDQLLSSMSQMVSSRVEVYYDVLRDDSQHSSIISAVMLLGIGLLLGLSLSLMLSHHGQKRWQLIISPLMGMLAYVVIKLHPGPLEQLQPAFREAIGFSLYGIVLMRKNNLGNMPQFRKGKKMLQNADETAFFGID